VIGEVLGVVARPKNAYFEGVKTLAGTRNPNVAANLARVREVAVGNMLRMAYERGANAVVGMRFDHRPISDSWNELCAYGTAVFVIPAPRPAPEMRPAAETPEAQTPQAGPRAIGGRRPPAAAGP
jgi:uncharacterized protein YbjQ (UPF0145 family)